MLEKERKKPARRGAAPKAASKPAPVDIRESRPVAPAAPVAADVPRPAVATATTASRPVAPVAPAPTKGAVSAAERLRMVAEAAYYRARSRGFGPGDPVRDWIEAEAEIDAQLLEGR